MEKRGYRGRYGLWVLLAAAAIFLYVREDKIPQEEKDLAPDLVRTVSIDDSHYLTVVAYRDQIWDKESFARMILEMYRQDSFQTIKVSGGSRGRGELPERLYIKVYLRKEDIGESNPVCQIKVEKGERVYLDGVEKGYIR